MQRSPFVSASREFRIDGGNRVTLEDADEQPVRRRPAIAIMRNVSDHDVRADDVTVHERVRGPSRLEPLDISQIAESDLGIPPAVPFRLHANQHVVGRSHGSLLIRVPREGNLVTIPVDRTRTGWSHPIEGGRSDVLERPARAESPVPGYGAYSPVDRRSKDRPGRVRYAWSRRSTFSIRRSGISQISAAAT
jgi:hypothetical protein